MIKYEENAYSLGGFCNSDEWLFAFLDGEKYPAVRQWWFAGGRIHKEESPEETLQREVKEETELEIESYRFNKSYSRVFPKGHDIT